HRLFEHWRRGVDERVEHEAVAHEELVLVLAHDGLARARPRAPVDALERIAGTVVAQREELLGVANRRRQRDAAGLVAARPRQRQRRQGIAARKDHERVRQLVWVQRAHEAERIGTRQAEAAKARAAAAARRGRHAHLHRGAPRDGRHRVLGDVEPAILLEEPRPAVIRDLPVEPVAARLVRLTRGDERGEVRARILQVLEQREARARLRPGIAHENVVGQRLAHRAEAGQTSARLEPAWPAYGQEDGQHEHGEGQGEDLVGHGEPRVGAEDHRPDERGGSKLARGGQAARERVLRARGEQELAIREPAEPHGGQAGTGTVLTISSTTATPVRPAKRACGSTARRWAMTEPATSCTWSGLTKAWPSSSASAWAAAMRASEARGLAPSCTPGAVRVARTTSTT